MRYHLLFALSASICLSGHAMADTTVQMHEVNAQGNAKSVGTVVISETPYGLVFTPEIKGIGAGIHGFHVHENPSCDPAEQKGKPVAAGAAGGHYDPEKTGKHGFPWGQGHLGDLPALYVNTDGNAANPVLAPRMKKLSDVSGRALMVHMGGDNHSDHPQPLGGGGSRIACGVIGK
ncbi:superoxide dismutase [Cu-Zn] SodC2 [Pollutimonas subterranea]|uniref:Superoxide dismutase [Cu-Zn] n=1 Tax=Pollutimonas subterranea TaxID=2045210 RepID=A0A2N4U3S6_9BURK|nr:superoxide dismutase family protein [Pollutimonas subterranea]PLC49674.1 superoxide dismutase [Cu-Zn] SodC2 [Pollutimonas subterranea]